MSGCVAGFARPRSSEAWEPWSVGQAYAPGHAGPAPVTSGYGAADRLLAWYQSNLRRPTAPGEMGCRFEPTCSAYARQAVAAHGSLVGVMQTLSRLFFRHGTATSEWYQVVRMDGALRLYDPPH